MIGATVGERGLVRPALIRCFPAPGVETAAARRIERVLWNDPATGVMRHADAGYESAIECARANGLDLPSLAL